VRGSNSIKLGEDIGRSFPHKKFVSKFGYFAAFLNVGAYI